MKITITEPREYEVKYLDVSCGVRYWEDASVDEVEDTDGKLIPCRSGDLWMPLIDVDTGIVLNWEKGKTADIHFKVCDEGVYTLLDADKNQIKQIDGYVPKVMCPEDGGYGDYVIMKIDADGKITNWEAAFDEWENEE